MSAGGDERTDTAAFMPLLDFVPPAVRLVADHGRLFLKDLHLGKQVEEGAVGARHGAEKLPSGKDAYAAGDQRPVQQFRVVSGIETASTQALVHRGQQILRDRGLGQRQQPGLVDGGGRALRVRLELAHRFDLVPEELHADRPVGFRGVDIEDAAAAGKLARHFDNVHGAVAHTRQVGGELIHVDLFFAAQDPPELRIVVRREDAHAGRLYRNDDDRSRAGRDLPQHGSALLLHVRVRRHIFKGQNIVCRKAKHALGFDRPGEFTGSAQGELERVGGLVVGDDHHHR